MVGIVIVSHSQKLAEGVVEVARMMAENVPIAAAGGLEDGSLGTSYERIHDAIDAVYSEDGVIVLADMGSAIMTAEIVLEDMPDKKIKILDCSLVEGAVHAAVDSVGGYSLEEIEKRVEKARHATKFID